MIGRFERGRGLRLCDMSQQAHHFLNDRVTKKGRSASFSATGAAQSTPSPRQGMTGMSEEAIIF
jgi:hypothetical protein